MHLLSPRWPGGRSWLTEGAGSVHQRHGSSSLNEGRSVNPGYTCGPNSHRQSCRPPLNEGRSVNPGYTLRAPGRDGQGEDRSTKAGASTPATPASSPSGKRTTGTLNEGRSVNPGYTMGLRMQPSSDTSLNEGRSVNPGYTPALLRNVIHTPWTLNEGRSVNPGYTFQSTFSFDSVVPAQRRPERQPRLHSSAVTKNTSSPMCAQRRPERQPPATRDRLADVAQHLERSTKAGASTPATHVVACSFVIVTRYAQRRPERQPRLHESPPPRRTSGLTSLNEGRSVNPGYTFGYDTITVQIQHAQRRPERQPRLHRRARKRSAWSRSRSTKAGASTPATLLNSAKGQYRDKPSLVHGCGSLDNDAFASISRDFGRYPVRMVRIKR